MLVACDPPRARAFLMPYREHRAISLGGGLLCACCGAKPRDRRDGFVFRKDGTCPGEEGLLPASTAVAILLRCTHLAPGQCKPSLGEAWLRLLRRCEQTFPWVVDPAPLAAAVPLLAPSGQLTQPVAERLGDQLGPLITVGGGAAGEKLPG